MLKTAFMDDPTSSLIWSDHLTGDYSLTRLSSNDLVTTSFSRLPFFLAIWLKQGKILYKKYKSPKLPALRMGKFIRPRNAQNLPPTWRRHLTCLFLFFYASIYRLHTIQWGLLVIIIASDGFSFISVYCFRYSYSSTDFWLASSSRE